MARITIITIGTRGDVQPYVALGLGLQSAGYEVCIATNDRFESFVASHGLDYYAVADDIQAILSRNKRAKDSHKRGKTPLQSVRGVTQKTGKKLQSLMSNCWLACQGSQAIIGSVIGFLPGQSIAEKMNVPYVSAYLIPTTQTKSFPHPLSLLPLPSRRMPVGQSGYNWLTHALTGRLFWLLFRSTFNKAREVSLGLPAYSNQRPYPVLYGYSPHVIPVPRDWRDDRHVTGYWFLGRDENWSPPPQLVSFLEDGPPPLYIGFGSTGAPEMDELLPLVAEALTLSNQRGIMTVGSAYQPGLAIPENLFLIDSIPHDWLFPKMTAVIHHGGAGTTGAGFRAGVPQLVLPHIADQNFWGQCVAQTGVGLPPIKRKHLTVERLAAGMTAVAENLSIHKQAAQLGQKIRAENGIKNAVKLVEHYLNWPQTQHGLALKSPKIDSVRYMGDLN